MFDKLCNTAIQKSLNIELTFLLIERTRLRQFGNVSNVPQKRLSKQTLSAETSGKRPVGRPQTR